MCVESRFSDSSGFFYHPDIPNIGDVASPTPRMIGTILAGCTATHAAMWAVTTVLRLTLIVVMALQLKRE